MVVRNCSSIQLDCAGFGCCFHVQFWSCWLCVSWPLHPSRIFQWLLWGMLLEGRLEARDCEQSFWKKAKGGGLPAEFFLRFWGVGRLESLGIWEHLQWLPGLLGQWRLDYVSNRVGWRVWASFVQLADHILECNFEIFECKMCIECMFLGFSLVGFVRVPTWMTSVKSSWSHWLNVKGAKSMSVFWQV